MSLEYILPATADRMHQNSLHIHQKGNFETYLEIKP